jgi:hypothetical protein
MNKILCIRQCHPALNTMSKGKPVDIATVDVVILNYWKLKKLSL